MLKIFGNPMSTCTRKVLMTLAETNAPFELTVVDFAKGEHKAPANLARQPFGRIPALDDDGFELFESRAMSRYLAEKGGKLVPADAKSRAKMEQFISVETSEFTPAAMKFIYQYVFGRPQEPGVIEAAGKALDTTVAVLDKQLAAHAFLAGNDFSLADVVYMPYFEYVMATPGKDILAKHPHVMAWWNKVSERPTWRKVATKH
jgi:glutathione S-transferase